MAASSLTKYRIWLRKFSTKYQALVLTIFAGLVTVLAIVLAIMFIMKYISYNNNAAQLRNIENQDIEAFKTNQHTENLYVRWDTIDDMISSLKDVREEKQGYENYQTLLNNPYNYFLQYQYLPRLNIWENPYTENVDISLIGSKFLEENPYTDLALINTWTRIFEDVGDVARDLGVSAANEVKDIEIGKIKELNNGYFAIPMSLSFESVDRRAFLLLMEKLAMTSHHSNITLINEFFFHVWETIKQEYEFELESLVINEGNMVSEKNIDKKLGYLFDQRINRNGVDFVAEFAKQQGQDAKNIDEIIAMAIRSAAGCTNQPTEECNYLFREKFRTVPYLIYPITNSRKSKSDVLKEFISFTLPPIIKINQFTFDDAVQQRGGVQAAKFEGKINIEVFGRGISEGEIKSIGDALGKTCFADEMTMSPKRSLDLLENNIIQLGRINALDTERSSEFFELKELFQEVNNNYGELTPYNKIIKLFEVYRMLNDASLCDTNN